jgi:hypothetical protein
VNDEAAKPRDAEEGAVVVMMMVVMVIAVTPVPPIRMMMVMMVISVVMMVVVVVVVAMVVMMIVPCQLHSIHLHGLRARGIIGLERGERIGHGCKQVGIGRRRQRVAYGRVLRLRRHCLRSSAHRRDARNGANYTSNLLVHVSSNPCCIVQTHAFART